MVAAWDKADEDHEDQAVRHSAFASRASCAHPFLCVCVRCVLGVRLQLWGDNWDDDEVGDDDFSKQLRAELAKKPSAAAPAAGSAAATDMKD